jgi:hypothetical protein
MDKKLIATILLQPLERKIQKATQEIQTDLFFIETDITYGITSSAVLNIGKDLPNKRYYIENKLTDVQILEDNVVVVYDSLDNELTVAYKQGTKILLEDVKIDPLKLEETFKNLMDKVEIAVNKVFGI